MTPLHPDEKLGVMLSLLVALFVAFRIVTPASIWFSVDHLSVNNAQCWRGVTVDYERTISHEFYGEWAAQIDRKEAGKWVAYATTPVTRRVYTDTNDLPYPITLEWFLYSEPKAYQLPEGEYRGSVTWTVNAGSFVFERNVTREFEFTVFGGEKCIQ